MYSQTSFSQSAIITLAERMLETLRAAGPGIAHAKTVSSLQEILSVDSAQVWAAAEILERRTLIRRVADQGAWMITAEGLVQNLQVSGKDTITVNIISAQNIVGSAIQLGSTGSTQALRPPMSNGE